MCVCVCVCVCVVSLALYSLTPTSLALLMFQDTREVVATAVDNDGESLFFASDRLKNDKSVAMLALARDGGTHMLFICPVVVCSCVLQEETINFLSSSAGSALQHVSPSLRRDLQVREGRNGEREHV